MGGMVDSVTHSHRVRRCRTSHDEQSDGLLTLALEEHDRNQNIVFWVLFDNRIVLGEWVDVDRGVLV